MLPSEWKRKKQAELSKPQVHKKIANTFIENVLHEKTLSAIKITYYLASILKDFDFSKELNTVFIDTKKMLEYTELTMTDIKNNLKKMQKTSISYMEEDKFEEHISLLPRFKIHLGRKRQIEIDIYSKIAKQLIEVTDRYTFINTKELMKLKSIHSIRLLPILHMINGYNNKQKTYTLEDLNSVFETEYKRFTDLERKILKKAKTELDNNSTLTFNYDMNFEALGTGRSRIVSVTIKPISKNAYQTTIFSNLDYEQIQQPAPSQEQEKNIKQIEEVKEFKLTQDIIAELSMKYGIAQTGNIELENEFEDYLMEQEEVFNQYCRENKKQYKNMTTSFKRHIAGAYKNKIDFFANM